MIIYGWNSKIIKHAPLENIECDNCKQKATSHLGIHSNYVHIFWVPVFPYSKSASIVCSECQHVTREKNMATELKIKIKALKQAVPIPKYQFSGLVAILGLVLYFVFQNHRSEAAQSEYVNDPIAGDVYVLKDDEEPTKYKYYLFKINELEKDSLLISTNSFSYTDIPADLDPQDGFYDLSFKIAKTAVLEFHENGELKKVIRDYKSHSGFNRILESAQEEALSDEAGLLYGE